MRAFIAVELSPGIKEALVRLSEELERSSRSIRRVAPENMHLTVRFLGDVEPSDVPAVEEAMRRACDGAESFSIELCGAGVFPDLRWPRVIYAGVSGDGGMLARLHDALEEGLRGLAVKPAEKRFHPHVTVGRVKPDRSAGRLGERMESFREWRGGIQPVAAWSLFGSVLSREGPTHTRLLEIPLGGKRDAF